MRRNDLFFAAVVSVAASCLAQQGDLPKRVYQMNQAQVNTFLQDLSTTESDQAARIEQVCNATLGQPYAESPLGEGTYDWHDPKPLYALDKADSRSFVEQTLAMSLATDVRSFVLILQRLRYKDGAVSTQARNHNLIADWAKNNSAWLLDDVTKQLAGGMAWVPLHQVVRKHQYLLDKYSLDVAVSDEKFIDSFIPRVYLAKVFSELRAGDIVLMITGDDRQQFSTEMGIILRDSDDSAHPLRLVSEQPPAAGKADFRGTTWQRKEIRGYKVLRLKPNALALAAGEAARLQGQVPLPQGLLNR